MAIIGIPLDNYKTEKFVKEFNKKQIKILSVKKDFMKGVDLIKVDSEAHIIEPIVRKLQKGYHDGYAKGN